MGAMVGADLGHLTAEEASFFHNTRALARETLAPLAEAGREGEVNRPLVHALGEHGLLGRVFPSTSGRFDPQSVSALQLCLIREALACECTEAETAFALQGLGAYPILLAGRPELVARWIADVAAGRAVAAFALTEPDAGTDVSSLELRAERADGGFRLSGVKTYISNAPDADVYSLFARTATGGGAKGVTAFAVPAGSEGLSGTPIQLLAPHPIGRLELDGVFVSDEDVLGEVHAGFRVAMRTLDLFRPSVGAFAVGMAQAALELAVEHAGRRHAFGKPLREFQAVSHRLAEMAMRTQAARLLVASAARVYDRGEGRVTKQAAMAKLFATETAQFVVDGAVQVHGAAALERGHPLEHLYREVRAPRIYEGTSEIQREIIARELYR
ncbi:MAG TPA: acyl-CoA dehydrogenase family protein [Thermoleophilaceae bacterium]|nr:acyl-CoA dehydrogenase family protein [Thermoleophilaceae bacterium]